MRRHTSLKLAVLALAPCLLLTSCGKPVDLGGWQGSQYFNRYFGLTVTIPDGWQSVDRETMRQVAKMGAKLLKSNKELARALESGDISLQLFMFSEHAMGAPVEFNHNMVCSIDKMSRFPGLRTAQDIHTQLRKQLSRIRIKVKTDAGGPVTLGSNTYHMTAGSMRVAGMEVSQEYYTIVKKGYALTFILSFTDGSDGYDMLKEALTDVTFRR